MPTLTSILLSLLPSTLVVAQNCYYDGYALGVAGSSQNETAYLEASQHPLYHNAVPFTGFSFPDIPAASYNASQSWTLHLNYSILPVNPACTSAQNTSDLVYSLEFPEEYLDTANSSDWSMAAYLGDPLPSSLTDNVIPVDNDGSCVPYLGQACYNEYIEALRSKLPNGPVPYPTPPQSGQLPSCNRAIDLFGYYGTISNSTADDVGYYSANQTYYNITTGQTIANPTFRGLQSGQAFASYSSGISSNLNATIKTNVLAVRMIAIIAFPSRAWINANPGAAVPDSNPRLFCARAVPASNVTSVRNAASSGKSFSMTAAMIAFMISGMAAVW